MPLKTSRVVSIYSVLYSKLREEPWRVSSLERLDEETTLILIDCVEE